LLQEPEPCPDPPAAAAPDGRGQSPGLEAALEAVEAPRLEAAAAAELLEATRVRKTPCWPRTWANFSLL
jgi:hypothetical protein